MKSKQAHIRLAMLLVLICFPVIAAAQVNEEQGESTISGRVVFADTGKPVGRAFVALYSNLSSYPGRMTPTNVRGEFRFNQVGEGTYFVVAEVSEGLSPNKAFAITQLGFNSDLNVEHTRVSVDGKGAVRCEVRVVRAGAIRGTIVYSDKEPVTGALIVLFRRKNGVTTQVYTGRITTNDRGMYRIDGLPEGEYLIGVADSVRSTDFENTATGLVTAYYPGVASIAEAKGILVQAGSEASAINITLREDELRQISGVIKWRDGGKPIEGASLRLRRLDGPEIDLASVGAIAGPEDYGTISVVDELSVHPTIQANAKGEWKFVELPPGKYRLTAFGLLVEKPEPDVSPGAEPRIDIDSLRLDSEWEPTTAREFELTVGETDLNDLVLEISKGTRISGVVVSDESPPPRVRISLHRQGRRVDDVTAYSSVDDGTFVLKDIPSGDTQLESELMSSSDLYVKSIMLGSHDLMRKPLRIEEATEISGVRIVLERGAARLSGRLLLDEGGSVAVDSGVLLVKADPALWQLTNARRLVMTNADGEFEMQCAPGDYLVFTWASKDQPLQPIDEFIRTNASSARRVSLRNGEEKQIELRVMKPRP